MRIYKRIAEGAEVQTFDEWKDLFETLLEKSLNPVDSEFTRNHSKHLDLLYRIIDLRNGYEDLIENEYREAYENFFIEVNRKYLKFSPTIVRKGGKVPIDAEVAKLLVLGIDLSKKETGNYIKFNEYYKTGLINCFELKERALFFGDNITSPSIDYSDLANLFPFDFPPVNKDSEIENRIINLKKSLIAAIDRDERSYLEVVTTHQRNLKKFEYSKAVSSDPYFQKLVKTSLLKKNISED